MGIAQRHPRQLQRRRPARRRRRGDRRRAGDAGGRGADIIDVGGESTRPGLGADAAATRSSARVLPVIRALAGAGALVSVDTRNAATMAAALDAGARIVNDVSALRHDPAAAARRGGARLPGDPDAHARRRPHHAALPTTTTWPLEVMRELATASPPRRPPGSPGAASRSIPASASPRPAPEPGTAAAPGAAAQPRLPDGGRRVAQSASSAGSSAVAAAADARLPGRSPPACTPLLDGAGVLRVHDVAETVQAVRSGAALARHRVDSLTCLVDADTRRITRWQFDAPVRHRRHPRHRQHRPDDARRPRCGSARPPGCCSPAARTATAW